MPIHGPPEMTIYTDGTSYTFKAADGSDYPSAHYADANVMAGYHAFALIEISALRQHLADARRQALEDVHSAVGEIVAMPGVSIHDLTIRIRMRIRRMIAEQPHKHKFDSDGGSCSCGATVAELLEQPHQKGQGDD